MPFSLTTAGPLTVATPTAAITGKGWVDVSAIRLQGNPSPLPVTWTNADTWSIALPLSAGTRVYTLEALSPRGMVLGTASLTITARGGLYLAAAGTLLASEINYNPPGSSDLTEFVELLNIAGSTLDLSGCHFDEVGGEGIAYTFPAGVQLDPGARILVVRDRATMTAQYGTDLNLAPGSFTGALDNSGETLVLYAANGQQIFRFTYRDDIDSTDGGGRTLVRVMRGTAPDADDYTWRASVADHGTPGTTDALAFSGDPGADADGDGYSALLEYAFGTSDRDVASIPAAPAITVHPDNSADVAWPLAPNADDIIATIETSPTLTAGAWEPQTGQTSTNGCRFYRLRIRLR